MANFMTPNGDFHLIDNAGNHFVNHKCVNPKQAQFPEEGNKNKSFIGETYPPLDVRTTLPNVTGSVPFRIDSEGRFIRL